MVSRLVRVSLSVLLASLALAGRAGAAPAAGALHTVGQGGCTVDNTMTVAGCAPGRGLRDFFSEAVVSPDDNFLYTAARNSNSIATFSIDPLTGGLTQQAAQTGCVVDDTATAIADCGTSKGLSGVRSVAVTENGDFLYAGSVNDDAVTQFQRNKDTGALTFVNCVSSDPATSGCTGPGRRMDGLSDVAVSPDGRSVYAAAYGSGGNSDGSVLVFTRNTDTGVLTQKAGATGCFAPTAAGTCTVDTVLNSPSEILVSPDNKTVYVTDGLSNAVIAYSRDTSGTATDGNLTPIDRTSGGGCLSATVAGCTVVANLAGRPENMALSGDGTRAYVSTLNGGKIVTLSRLAGGGLTPVAGGCVRETGDAGCPGSAFSLKSPYGLAAQGSNLYVGNTQVGNQGVLAFDLDGGGLPVQKPKPYGCVNAVLEGCTTVQGMADMYDAVASRNGRFAYSWGNSRVFAFARDRAPSCQPASATVEQGSAVTIQLSCADADADALSYAIDAQPTQGTLGAPSADAKVTYVAAASAGSSDSFTYHATAFGVASDQATVSITITPADKDGDGVRPPADCNDNDATIKPGAPDRPGDGIDQDCNGVDPPFPVLKATPYFKWRLSGTSTIFKDLGAKRLTRGEKLKVTCAGKHKNCPPTRKLKTRTVGRQESISFARFFKRRKLKPGAVITVKVTKADSIGRVSTAKVRKKAKPKITKLCLPPGSTRPRACR